jgi:hypothetical protein
MPYIETPVSRQKLFTGTTVAENIDGENAISPVGTGTARTEQPGRCYLFDNSDDDVNYGNPSELQITGALSVSVWFRQDGSDNTLETLLSKYNWVGDQQAWVIYKDTGTIGQISFLISADGRTYNLLTTPLAYADGNWHHLLVTFSPSAHQRIYIDGVLIVNGTSSVPESLYNSSAAFIMAGTVAGYTWNGGIFDVRVFNSAIDADNTDDLGKLIRFETTTATPVFWAKCDDTHDTVSYDSSGNENNGTKQNITPSTFHQESSAVPYSFQNQVGFSNRQNYLESDSEDFSTWTGSTIDATQDATVDPDGGTNAWKLEKNETGSSRSKYSSNNLSSGVSICEIWVKEGNSDQLDIGVLDRPDVYGPLTWVSRGPEVLSGSATVGLIGGGRIRITNISGWTKIRFYSDHVSTGKLLYIYPDTAGSTTSGNYNYVYHPHLRIDADATEYQHTTNTEHVMGRVPRDESNITKDVLDTGEISIDLRYSGIVPANAKLINSNCGTFDGTDDIIEVGDLSADVNTWTSSYIHLRFKHPSDSLTILFSCKHTGSDDLRVGLNDAGTLSVMTDDYTRAGGGTVEDITTTLLYDDNEWHEMTFVHDNVAGTLNLTVDTEVVKQVAGNWQYSSADGATTVGGRTGGTFFVQGQLCDVQFGKSSTDLILDFPLSEGSGTTVYDISPGNNDSTVTGATSAEFWATLQNVFHHNVTKGFTSGTVKIPALANRTLDAAGNAITNPANLFNSPETEINFAPVASPRTVRLYKGYADFAPGAEARLNLGTGFDMSADFDISADLYWNGAQERFMGGSLRFEIKANSDIYIGSSSRTVTISPSLPVNTWFTLRIRRQGTHVTIWVDGSVYGISEQTVNLGTFNVIGGSSTTAARWDGRIRNLHGTDSSGVVRRYDLYKDALDSGPTNDHCTNTSESGDAVIFPTYTLDTTYAFGDTPTGLTKVESGVNESYLEYAETLWVWTVISPVVAGPDIGSHIFVNIGGTTQEAAVRTNGHFVGGNDDILAMTTYDGQFRRNTIHRG